jgi:two-component system LytT family response regulator
MPELNGFGVVSSLVEHCEPGQVPATVFVTAHDEYALRAFEAHAIDYLLKPFSDERFQASLDRAIWHCRAGQAHAMLEQMKSLLGALAAPPLDGNGRAGTSPQPASAPTDRAPHARASNTGASDASATKPVIATAAADARHVADTSTAPSAASSSASSPPAVAPLDRIVLKTADRVRLLPVQQITWIEAAGMYVRLHMRDGAVHLHRSLLGDLDAALDPRRFVRIHRSAIVNIDVIDELQQDVHGDYMVVLKDRTEVRLGRRYRERLQQRLGQPL